MAKFHIKPDGTVAPCKATKGKCPYGGEENHYATKEEAQIAFQKRMEKEHSPRPEGINERGGVDWQYYNRFKNAEKSYLPKSGEGDSFASQKVTACTKLVYKWYNDGDVFDNNHALSGWANDLSSYANWLYENEPETKPILDRIYEIKTNEEYEVLLKDLTDKLHEDEQLLHMDSNEPKSGTIYDADGPFSFSDLYEEDEEERCYNCGEVLAYCSCDDEEDQEDW
jgi:hypothetical protein